MGKNKKINGSDYIIQGTILAAAGIIVRIIGLFYRIPLTNILGNQGNSYYGYAYEIYSMLILLSSVSLPIAISKMVSARMVHGKYKSALKVLQSSLYFALATGLVLGLLTYTFAGTLANFGKFPESVYALKVLGPTIFVLSIVGVLRGYFQGVGTMIPTALSQVFEGIVNAIVSIWAASRLSAWGLKLASEAGADPSFDYKSAYGAAGGASGTAASAVVALIFLLFVMVLYRKVIRKQLRRDRSMETESYRDIYRVLLLTVIPVILSTVVYNCTHFIDQTIFGNFQAAQGISKSDYSDVFGIYGSKFRMLMNVPLSIASCLTPSMIPSITAAKAAGDMKVVKERIHTSVRYTMVITIPCCTGLMALAGPVLYLLYRDSDPLASKIVIWGSLMIAFFAYSTLGNGILQGIDKLKEPIINGVITLVAHVALLAGLMYFFKDLGIFAVIISNIFFGVLMSYLNARSIKKALRYKQEIQLTFIIPLLCSCIMGICAYVLHLAVNNLFLLFAGEYLSNAVGVVAAIIGAVIIYGVSILKLKGISEEELLGFPKGYLIVRAVKKLHII